MLADFVCGANEKDAHLTGVNWDRDVKGAVAADLRNVVAGDPSPSGRGTLKIVRGIEVGHIFRSANSTAKRSKPRSLMKAQQCDAVHGLLRNWRDAGRGRRHRTESR